MCEFAGFVLGALRFLYSVRSTNYVCQKKSFSTALNQEFALEMNDAPNEFDDIWEDTELQDDCSPLTLSDDDSPNRPHHSQEMMTLLDKGETDVSCDVEIIEVRRR